MSNKNLNSKELNKILKEGGVIAFVTDTVWGIGCLPSSERGVNRIYEIKGRDRTKPLILMSDDIKYLLPYTKGLSCKAEELAAKYFPGALTIVTEKSEQTPDYITSNKDTVGIRVPDNKFFKDLCSAVEGHVLATTSANLSGQPSAKTYEDAKKSVGDFVDIVYEDGGCTCAGMESTVVAVLGSGYKILRCGSIIL